jgi:aminomethyltransferase
MRFVVDASARSRVWVKGPDAAAFLHRLSTQHVIDLNPGEARLNALTTDKGRLKDLLHHLVLDEGVLLVGHHLPGADLIAWLDRYLFSEQLTLADAGGGCVDVDEAGAAALVPGAADLDRWQMKRQGDVVVVRGFDRVDVDGVVVKGFVAVSLGPALPAATTSAGDDLRMKVAAGIPTAEIGEAHTPLDLDLHDAISWNKGCYIGQEVIARLDTYGKQKKHLVGVVVDEGGAVAVGDAVAGALAGAVTSAAPLAWAPSQPSALALVKGAVDGAVDVTVAGRAARLVKRQAQQSPHD